MAKRVFEDTSKEKESRKFGKSRRMEISRSGLRKSRRTRRLMQTRVEEEERSA